MNYQLNESQRRLYNKLYRDLGNDIIRCLQDDNVNEIMLNPDGKLWIDNTVCGLQYLTELDRAQAFAIISDVAGIHNFVITQHNPRLEAELPFFQSLKGERFTAQIPPIVVAPSFTIRKKSEIVFNLDEYVTTNRLNVQQKELLQKLVHQRKNILICGGPGSGKTTVTNALIVEAVTSDTNQRFVILEDLPELQCCAINQVSMLTTDQVNMRGLLRAAMRMRPDRILVGEVRGGEALDMLKAWNTGCPGGICTVHANGAEEAIQRILDLAMEAGLTVPPIQLVCHTVDAIVGVIRQGSQKGFIKEIVAIKGYEHGHFRFEKLV
ncbi:MAG: P-type conjugative transfer ATPase TrbB [Gammaproteobacteria bacterium]